MPPRLYFCVLYLVLSLAIAGLVAFNIDVWNSPITITPHGASSPVLIVEKSAMPLPTVATNSTAEFLARSAKLLCPVSSRSCECLRAFSVLREGSVCESDSLWDSSRRPYVRLAPEGSTWLAGEARRGRFDCLHSRCEWGGYGIADAYVNSLPPLERAPFGGVHALVSVEACHNYPDACNGKKLSTLGYTHLLRAQTASAGIWQDALSYVNTDLSSFATLPIVLTAEKKNAVAVIISNCGDVASGRKALIQELIRTGVIVHSFGACMKNAEIESHAPECAAIPRSTSFADVQKLCIIRAYRFTAAFESVIAPGYITEKLFQPLLVGTVPLYLGDPGVRDVLPSPAAALLVSDFSSHSVFASHILGLMANDSAYNAHLMWRNEVFALGFRNAVRKQYSSLQCRMCDGMVLATQLQLCQSWVLVEMPQDELSLIVLGIAYEPELARVRILAFVEGFDYFVGDGRVQAYPSSRSSELSVSISYLPDAHFTQCSQVVSFADTNHIICPVEGTLRAENASWVLRVKRVDDVLLPLPLCPATAQFPADPESPRVGVCVATVYMRHTTLRTLLDFAEYHRALQVDQVTFLMREDAFALFSAPLSAAYPDGSVVAVKYGVSSRDPNNAAKWYGYYDQEMAINHCFMRARGQVDWLGVFDLDEYFFTPQYDSVVDALRRVSINGLLNGCIRLHSDRVHDPFVELPNSIGLPTVHSLHSHANKPEVDNGSEPLFAKFFCHVLDFNAAINHLGFSVSGNDIVADSSYAVVRHAVNMFADRQKALGTFKRLVDEDWSKAYGARVDLALLRSGFISV